MKFQKGDLVAIDVSGWYQTVGIILEEVPHRNPQQSAGFVVFDFTKQCRFYVLGKNAKKIG